MFNAFFTESIYSVSVPGAYNFLWWSENMNYHKIYEKKNGYNLFVIHIDTDTGNQYYNIM